MSIVVETLLLCDGKENCPMDGPYAEGDPKVSSASTIRQFAHDEGWITIHGKDYCPGCAARRHGGRKP